MEDDIYTSLKYIMSENIELLFNIKEIQICWREEFTTDARITTPPSQTSTRSLRPQVSICGDDFPFPLPPSSFANLRDLGGKLTIQYLKRKAGSSLAGVPRLRSPALSRLTRTQRTVARPYGGKLTHSEVRDKYVTLHYRLYFVLRIVRAFLIEEVKQMKRLMQQKERSSKKNKKSKSKGKKK